MTDTELKRKIIQLVRPFCIHSYEAGSLLSVAEEEMYDDVMALLQQSNREQYLKGVKDLKHEIDCNTLISEMYGWRGILDQSAENVIDRINPESDTGGDT